MAELESNGKIVTMDMVVLAAVNIYLKQGEFRVFSSYEGQGQA